MLLDLFACLAGSNRTWASVYSNNSPLFRIEFDKLAGESDKVTGLREIGLFLPPCTITMVEVEGFDLKDSAYSKTQTEARIKNVLHSLD